MKIAFVLDDTLDSTDGVQQYVLTLGGYYSSQGHEVHYITGNTKRRDIDNVHSLSKNLRVGFNKNVLSTPLFAPKYKIKRLLSRHKFDVIHVQMPYSPLLGGRVISAASKRGIPIVATFHILPASSLAVFGLKILSNVQKLSSKQIDMQIAVSEPAKKCVDELYKTNAKVIPNPVDINRYKSKKVSSSKIKIVFLGRLVVRKGCGEFLRAIKWLHERHYLDGVEVEVAGDGHLRKLLVEYVTLHNLKNMVKFRGRVTEDEKISMLGQANLAVFPSMYGESFGIVLIEAMAAGSETVIAGNNPGYRFVMGNREQQIVDPKDTQVFAAQLLHFIQNESARHKSYEWQQKHVLKFNVDHVGNSLLEIYADVIAKNSNKTHTKHKRGEL